MLTPQSRLLRNGVPAAPGPNQLSSEGLDHAFVHMPLLRTH